MESELKPCPRPWCKHFPDDLLVGRVPGGWQVRCGIISGCGMLGPILPSREEAVAAWNHRPEEERLHAVITRQTTEIERLRNALVVMTNACACHEDSLDLEAQHVADLHDVITERDAEIKRLRQPHPTCETCDSVDCCDDMGAGKPGYYCAVHSAIRKEPTR